MKGIDCSDEVKFQVGQRVELDLPLVPVEERDVTTGIIEQIRLRFPRSPKLRSVEYTFLFDNNGNYIKEEFQRYGGIKHRFVIRDASKLKVIK